MRISFASILVVIAIVLAMILGAATGLGTAVLRLRATPWNGDPQGTGGVSRIPSPAPTGPAPKAVVDRQEYDFGTMDIDDEGTHDFVFVNAGETPLELSVGATSCRCTAAEIDKKPVPPGESGKVTVTFTADDTPGPYRETATILTNDPQRRRVMLTIVGRITATLRCIPTELVFSRLAADETARGQVKLLCYLDEPLEIRGYELANAGAAGHFEVTFQRLTTDQLEEETKTKSEKKEKTKGKEKPGKKEKPRSGYLVRVTVKPGLPLGEFRQKILVNTNLESAPTVEIPVRGRIGSDISIVGPGWNDKLGVLTFGTVSSREGAQLPLILLVRGPYRDELQLKHVRSVPNLLKVEPGERSPVSDRVSQIMLIIQIPKGTRPVNHLGSKQGKLGEILIETNHPELPQLRIRVSFAVRDQ